jgi:hypothetical protein
MTSIQDVLARVQTTDIRPDSREEKKILEYLASVFLRDFPVGKQPYCLDANQATQYAETRALIWMKLWSKGRADQLEEDCRRARVSVASIDALKKHEYPLPFESHNHLLGAMRALAEAIKKDAPALGSDFKVIISGSGTTFYSENPNKPGKFFDQVARSGKQAGDIDMAIASDDVRKMQRHFGRPPNYLGCMWGSTLTLQAFPSLKDFYMRWGNNPHGALIGAGKKKYYDRDIGIVTFCLDWKDAAPYSRNWRKDYVYDAAQDKILPTGTKIGGGKLCRYGRWCTRCDCHHEHE